ncbi:hypothetical protein NA78x_003795 [Anatilimnocola sp. NA78]|uniref:hypothetical protein n=1 Tax=Anatilimnocola sp. NA78 TaxID=3415683 RepID=UPI003CE4B860
MTLKEPAAAKIDWPRHVARLSIIAAVACCLSQIAYAQLSAKEKSPEWSTADRVVSAAGIALLLSGVVLGIVALTAAIRRSNYDTGVIAVIGLFLNGGLLSLIAWWVLVVRPSLPLQ